MKDQQKPTRKQNRLKEFSYDNSGAYFITICAKERKNLFWGNLSCNKNNVDEPVGATISRPQKQVLTRVGQIVEKVILDIPTHYPMITVDKHVVMPNHLHMILQIHSDDNGRPMVAPTISNVVQQTKGVATKMAGCEIFQKSFYDHVIRNQEDYDNIWQYIDTNPLKWRDDELFFED